MVTLAEEPEVETTKDKAEGAVRSAIAGHPQGAVRRILLYVAVVIAFLALVLFPTSDLVAAMASVVGVASVLLLAVTDQLV
jgi:hypothetical protein